MIQKKNMYADLVEFFVEVLKKNYPEENEEELRSFVNSNASTLLEEFQIAYGFISREDLEAAKAEAKEKILNTKDDEQVKQV